MDKELLELFEKYNIKANESQIEKFDLYYNDLIKYNKIHNLTTITERKDVNTKHFLDSVICYKLFEEKKYILDIGCGAGFPSIPLSIIREDLNFTAIDSVNKKIEFVKNEINTLKLKKFEAKHIRIEEFAHTKEFRESFDYVVSRAVAPMSVILEYSAPMLKNNGYIIAYKGANYAEELEISKNALNKLNCKVESIKEYYIDEINAKRYIIIVKKFNNIPDTYPRPKNKPRSSPL